MDGPTEQDRIYAHYRVLGFTQYQAARRAGFSRATGQLRECETWWSDLLAEIRAELIQDERGMLDTLTPKAWRVLDQSLDLLDVETAKYIIDRRFGKAVQRNENKESGELTIRVQYDDVDDHAATPPPDPEAGESGGAAV